jgi:hypothetical protein
LSKENPGDDKNRRSDLGAELKIALLEIALLEVVQRSLVLEQ